MNVDATWVDIGCLSCDLLRIVLAFDRRSPSFLI